jgi:hypothetical protein
MKPFALLASIAALSLLPSLAMAQIVGQGTYGQRIDNGLKTGQLTPAQAAQGIVDNAHTLHMLQSMGNHDGLGYDTSAGQQSRIYGAQYNDLMQQAAAAEALPPPNYAFPTAKPLSAPSNAMVSAPSNAPPKPKSGFVKPSATPPQ